MCRVHWNEYTTALRKAALERKAADGEGVTGKENDEAVSEPEAVTVDAGQPADVTATTSREEPKTAKRDGGRRRAKEGAKVAQEGATS